MIEVEKVSRSFGSFRAVDDISFSVRKGEIVGLLGPNGAGKTTTMRMITGFLDPSEGTILIDGRNIADNPNESKRKIGYMPESAPLYSDMIVEDYLAYVASVQGEDAGAKVPRLAHLCGIAEVMHKNIGDLSRGYRQRVGLAHALMNDPEILILDEPTSGLDPNQIIEVRNLIKEIGKTRTVIISTHILSEVEMLCDRVIIISRGTIVADSPTGELRQRYGHRSALRVQVAGCSASELEKATASLDGVAGFSAAESDERDADGMPLVSALLSVSGERDIRPAVFAAIRDKGWIIYEMGIQRNSLEDVFRSLTTGGDEQ
jgi:ABC-2 type transport system ATP-binding protein